MPSNSKPPQIKMQSTKKTAARKEDGTAATGDEAPTIAQPSGSSTAQGEGDDDPQIKEGNKENKPKSGGGGRRRGGQRHKGKGQNSSTNPAAAPSSSATGN
ncbi:GTP-binding protein 1 [Oryzias melastigma]|nr:GTP-binding protein 1 [Oryzias melastigma]